MRTKWQAAFFSAVMVLGLAFLSAENTYAQQNAYNQGYEYGRQDKSANQSRDFKRHRSQYTNRTKNDFKQGYNDGYRDASNNNWGNVWRPGNPDWGQSGGRQNPPRWMVGTFRGYTPGNATYTRITVNPDGNIYIAAENGNASARGYYNNGRVFFEWGEYRFRRQGNGFRAENQSNGADRVFYQRIN